MDTRGDLYFKLNQEAEDLFDMIEKFRVLHIEHEGEVCFCALHLSGILSDDVFEGLDATDGWILIAKGVELAPLRERFEVIEVGDRYAIRAGYYSRAGIVEVIKPAILHPPKIEPIPPPILDHSEIDRIGKQYLLLNDRLTMMERAEILKDYYIEAVTYQDQPRTAIILEEERNPQPQDLDDEEIDDVYFITGIKPTAEGQIEGEDIFEGFVETPEPCLLFSEHVPAVYIEFLGYTFEVIDVKLSGIDRKAIPSGIFR